MIRYFNANVEDAVRIAVVEAENEDDFSDIPLDRSAEIAARDLPDDFATWQRYEAFAYLNGASVEVLSRDGG